MPENELSERLENLERMLGELLASNAGLNSTIHERNLLVLEQGKALDEVKNRLPTFVPRSRLRKIVAALTTAGLILAGTLGVALSLNHRTTCGVRAVLILAQNTVERSPEPTDPALIERRKQALDFYDKSLDKLKILWPCKGEEYTPTTARP